MPRTRNQGYMHISYTTVVKMYFGRLQWLVLLISVHIRGTFTGPPDSSGNNLFFRRMGYSPPLPPPPTPAYYGLGYFEHI